MESSKATSKSMSLSALKASETAEPNTSARITRVYRTVNRPAAPSGVASR